MCGSLDYAGAALLSATAAARAGAGLVALAVPASLQPTLAGRVPEAITIGMAATQDGDIDAEAAGHACQAEGPGCASCSGRASAETDGYRDLLLGLLDGSGPPIVVDGGGARTCWPQTTDWWSTQSGAAGADAALRASSPG